MALPYSRNTTYSPGASPVSANDLNALQDEVCALFLRGAHDVRREAFCPRLAHASTAWIVASLGHVAATHLQSQSAGAAVIEIPCTEGDEVRQVDVIANGTGPVDPVDVTYSLYLVSDDMTVTLKANVVDTSRALGYRSVPVVPTETLRIPARARVALVADASAGGYLIGSIVKVFARP